MNDGDEHTFCPECGEPDGWHVMTTYERLGGHIYLHRKGCSHENDEYPPTTSERGEQP